MANIKIDWDELKTKGVELKDKVIHKISDLPIATGVASGSIIALAYLTGANRAYKTSWCALVKGLENHAESTKDTE